MSRTGSLHRSLRAMADGGIWFPPLQQKHAWRLAVQRTTNQHPVAQQGGGFRFPYAYQWIDRAAVCDALTAELRHRLAGVCHALALDSSNQSLLQAPFWLDDRLRVLLTDHQWQGQGQRGRVWQAEYGRHLLLSWAWQETGQQSAGLNSTLPLMVAGCVGRVLTELGLCVHIKWPNDVYCAAGKLAGILVQSRMQGAKRRWVVGLGLNVQPAWKGAAYASVQQALGRPVVRQDLLVRLLNAVLPLAESSEQRQQALAWMRAHQAWLGCRVTITQDNRCQTGRLLGIADYGALLLHVDGRTQAYVSGSISLA